MIKKNKHIKIGIVIPAANESPTINDFYKALQKEINKLDRKITIYFVVDTVSQDDTLKKLRLISKKNKNVNVIFEPKNRNVVDAYVKGFKEAISDNCEYIIEMDSGFSHKPEELNNIISAMDQGFDCVFGFRPLTSIKYNVPLLRRIYSAGGTILANILLGMDYKDATSGFIGYKKSILQKLIRIPLKSTGHFWHTEIRYRAKNYNYKEIPITYDFPSRSVRKQVLINSFQTLFYLTKNR